MSKSSAKVDVVIGTTSEHLFEIHGQAPPFTKWVSNIPWPGFAIVELPNGDQWDVATFSPHQLKDSNPWPVYEPCKAVLRYTGFIPPTYCYGAPFAVCINIVRT